MTDLFVKGYTDCLDGLDPQSMDPEYLHGYDCELQSIELFEKIYN